MEAGDHHLITSLETDVVLCLGDDCVLDYLITQLAKILQKGSQLLQDISGEAYPPTQLSATPSKIRSTTLSSKAANENIGSTVPLWQSRENDFRIGVLTYYSSSARTQQNVLDSAARIDQRRT